MDDYVRRAITTSPLGYQVNVVFNVTILVFSNLQVSVTSSSKSNLVPAVVVNVVQITASYLLVVHAMFNKAGGIVFVAVAQVNQVTVLANVDNSNLGANSIVFIVSTLVSNSFRLLGISSTKERANSIFSKTVFLHTYWGVSVLR